METAMRPAAIFRRLVICLLVVLSWPESSFAETANPVLPSGFPSSSDWRNHLTRELMPFWTHPAALGDPLGNFPSVRCNDRSRIDYANPCGEVANGYLLQRRTTIVAMSRQVYGYCMAFHMTGSPLYLRYAEAGVAYIRENAIDRVNGGVHVYRDDVTGLWDDQPKLRNSQELAYALLGLSCYHMITRDPAVRAEVVALKRYIFSNYWNTSLGLLQWQLEDGNGLRALDQSLTAQLDQLPYLLLMVNDLPSTERTLWKRDISRLADVLVRVFYSSEYKLFRLQNNAPGDKDIAQVGTDFGHSAKILWNLKIIGRLTGRTDLVTFANKTAPAVLSRAFLPVEGAWASGILPGGIVDRQKSWWIYAELDQLSGVMALGDVTYLRKANRTYKYWFNHFVDKVHGEVWSTIEADGNAPTGGLPKSWFWKNAFHSVEHAVFGYVTTRWLERKTVPLYFAFKKAPSFSTVRPNVFAGKLKSLTSTANGTGRIYKAVFSDISF
jgi:mannose/cellobiose epimerase-like protein (N-acyl-D-glucosamine 2-epimerase family)